jgi:PTH2 family peptidyl-tRNA hydrolase
MNDDRSTKQVIVLRKDLKMRKGKMVSQGAHSSGKVFFDRGKIETFGDGNKYLVIPLTDDMVTWVDNIFTKVCCGVDSEDELLELYAKAKLLGLPCSLIQDIGLTEFDGVPTYTAISIGPAKNEEVDLITGHLKLL